MLRSLTFMPGIAIPRGPAAFFATGTRWPPTGIRIGHIRAGILLRVCTVACISRLELRQPFGVSIRPATSLGRPARTPDTTDSLLPQPISVLLSGMLHMPLQRTQARLDTTHRAARVVQDGHELMVGLLLRLLQGRDRAHQRRNGAATAAAAAEVAGCWGGATGCTVIVLDLVVVVLVVVGRQSLYDGIVRMSQAVGYQVMRRQAPRDPRPTAPVFTSATGSHVPIHVPIRIHSQLIPMMAAVAYAVSITGTTAARAADAARGVGLVDSGSLCERTAVMVVVMVSRR